MISINQIKKLREETGVSIGECKKALEMASGDPEKAKDVLKKWGKEIAQKRAQKTTSQGIVESYIHSNKKLGVLLELNCETDFVAKSGDFQNLAHEICLQVAGFNNQDLPLLSQPWIKDESKTIGDLVNEHIGKIGENISVKRFARFEI